ncbi:MAG: rhodanese-like domain-containing protein [Bdellovibrionales bacterium]|jgi:3-mercaptopyruvate sulfurtransferase SseA|nr:rhodanese-like domain-containing protein [Bdellovibrionales bacterium]
MGVDMDIDRKARSFQLFMAIGLLLVAVGCQTKPTVVRETAERGFGGEKALLGPITLDEAVVVVDTRPKFDFSMARIPRSVSINWADYSEAEPNKRGWPQRDIFAAARRLARLGIAPDSKVVIFGQGLEGQGEEGKVAWLLAYLGVENVRFARFGSVRTRITTEAMPESVGSAGAMGGSLLGDDTSGWNDPSRSMQPAEAPVEAKPIWKPEVASSLIVLPSELKGAIQNRAVEKPWASKAAAEQGAKPRLYRIIDVRPEKEYLGQRGGLRSKAIPNIDAVNIPWKEFFTPDFRPDTSLVERLRAVGIAPEYRIVVIDSDGVASAAVTMALRAFGYSDAGNYAGGYNDLMP